MFCQDVKVMHETVANISHLPDDLVFVIQNRLATGQSLVGVAARWPSKAVCRMETSRLRRATGGTSDWISSLQRGLVRNGWPDDVAVIRLQRNMLLRCCSWLQRSLSAVLYFDGVICQAI